MTADKKVEVRNDQQKAQDFIKEYEELCKKHQMNLVANPAYRARDDGTFSLVIQFSVGKMKQE